MEPENKGKPWGLNKADTRMWKCRREGEDAITGTSTAESQNTTQDAQDEKGAMETLMG